MNDSAASTRNKASILKGLGAASLLALGAACTTIEAPMKPEPVARSAGLGACADWFVQLDAAVDQAGVRDAGAYRIPGFPYLRADRFSASFADLAKGNAEAFQAWVARLRELDARSREYEIGNLPPRSFPLGASVDRAAAKSNTRACAAQLADEDLGSAPQRDLVAARAKVPDSYVNWNGMPGLYALASIPFARGVEKWHEETAELFRKASAETGPIPGVVRYRSSTDAASEKQVNAIFARLRKDALGIPQFTDGELETLFRAYAPAFEIDTTGDYDRFGPLVWRNSPAPEVDTARPLAYRRLALTRSYGKVLAQLVYTIWFPERPSSGAADLLAGRLDGVVFRVTLGGDGAPLLYDTIHPCGCYHMFFPTAGVKLLPAQEPVVEWAFVPSTLPAIAPAQRVAVRIESRTHYVVNVRPDTGASGKAYQFADENDLRALPTADGGTRSAYGPDGIVPGTDRGERYLFWPMGIENAGAMRQWGTHATAFVGRRHFDDADLLERRFDMSSGGQQAAMHPK